MRSGGTGQKFSAFSFETKARKIGNDLFCSQLFALNLKLRKVFVEAENPF